MRLIPTAYRSVSPAAAIPNVLSSVRWVGPTLSPAATTRLLCAFTNHDHQAVAVPRPAVSCAGRQRRRHAGRLWARRLARPARSKYPGDGGTHPACLAIARSSRLAQCSMIMPFRVRNRLVSITTKAFPAGGMAASTMRVSGC